jgi:hypothetical protein
MNKNMFIRVLLSVVCLATVLFGTVAHAAQSSLPTGILIGDSNGIRVSPTGEYFINADGLEPGDVITYQLYIQNTEPYDYHLSMMVEPLEETGLLKLLDEVRCTLTLDGQVIYDGRIRGNEGIDMTKKALEFGLVPSGGQRTLDIKLTVSPDMEKHYWTVSEAFLKWHFYAYRTTDHTNVKTGDVVGKTLTFLIVALPVVFGALLYAKKRENERLREQIALW